MNILKKIIIWLVVLIALLVVVAYLLPKTYHVERSVLIKAEKQTVFDMVCDFEKWHLWTPWSSESDTTAVMEFIGNCEVGALQRWDGEDMGKGEMMLTEKTAPEKLRWELGFEGQSNKMLVGMDFLDEGGDVLVSWTADGDLGYNPLYRYYGLMIDSKLGADYERGLLQLKEVCEALPDYPGIGITLLESGPAISIKDSVTYDELGPFMETYMPQMYLYAIRQGGKIAGHPYSIYHSWDTTGLPFLVEVGIPLEELIEGEGMMQPAKTPGGEAVKAVYNGPYENLIEVYTALEQYIAVMKLDDDIAGMAYEVYVTDPAEEPDPQKWETHVFFPLK